MAKSVITVRNSSPILLSSTNTAAFASSIALALKYCSLFDAEGIGTNILGFPATQISATAVAPDLETTKSAAEYAEAISFIN